MMNRTLTNTTTYGSYIADGATSYIDCGSGLRLDNRSFTVEYWAKTNASTDGDYMCVGQHEIASVNKSLHIGFRVSGNGNNCNAYFGFFSNDLSTSTTAVEMTKWHHYAFVYDYIAKIMTIYIDGVFRTSKITTLGDYAGIANVNLARWHRTPNYANVTMCEVRFWDTARTKKEITDNMYNAIKPQPGLIGYYRLNGNARDSSGNNRHGTEIGSTAYTQDGSVREVSQVPVFDGVNDTINCGNSAALNITSNITVEAWVYRPANNNASWVRKNYQYGMQVTTGGAISVHIHNGTSYSILGGKIIPNDTWTHIAFTYNGSALSIYVNGVLNTSMTVTATINPTTNNLYIGSLNGTSEYGSGRISLVRVWNVARTRSEIFQSMFSVLPSTTVGLAEQWVLNGDTLGTKGINGILMGDMGYTHDKPTLKSDVSDALVRKTALTTFHRKGCAVFKNSDANYIYVRDSQKLNPDYFTIEAWGQVNTTATITYATLFRKDKYGLRFKSNGTSVDFFVYVGGVAYVNAYFHGLPNNTYVHLAGVYDGTTLALYLNGSLVKTINAGAPNTPPDKNGSHIHIGKAGFDGQALDGIVSDIRIWEYPRSAQQIKDDYKRILSPQPGLAAYLRLNGNAMDSSGNGSHGVIAGDVAWSVDGKVPVAQVGNFNGSSMSTPVKYLQSTTGTTQEAWVKRTASLTNQFIITSSTRNYLQCSISTGATTPRFSLYIDEGGTLVQKAIISPVAIPSDTWTHIAGTYDGLVLKLYINGILSISTIITGTIVNDTSAGVIGDAVDGSLSAIRVWSKALTQSEIQANMFRILPTGTTGLIEQWTLDGNANGTNGNNGTMNGGATFSYGTPELTSLAPPSIDTSKLLNSRSVTQHALALNGVDGYMGDRSYASLLAPIPNNSYTFEIWVKLNSIQSGWRYFISSVPGASTSQNGGVSTAFMIGVAEGRFSIDYSGNGVNSNITLTAGVWTHLALSYNHSTKDVRFYQNGTYVSTINNPVYIGQITNSHVFIGARPTSAGAINSNSTLDGNIANLRIWKGVQSDQAINDNMWLTTPKDTTNLIEQWSFDNYGGVGLTGTRYALSGTAKTTPSTAPVGQRSGLYLQSASNSYIGIPAITNQVAFGTNAHTLEAWVYPMALINDYNYIVSMGSGTGATGNQTSMGIRGAGNVFQSAFSAPIVNFAYSPPMKKWTHLVITHSAGVSHLYVNGVLTQSVSITLDVKGTITYINAHQTKLSNLVAHISNVRLWDKALTSTEIKANMHRYLPASTPNLVEQWKLNEGVGSTVYGTKGNNGTITGTATWTTPSLMNWKNKVARFTNATVANNTWQVPHSNSLAMTDKFTVEFWYYPIGDNPSYSWNISKQSGTTDSTWSFYHFGHYNNVYPGSLHKVHFYGTTDDGVWGSLTGSYILPATDKWYHIAFTYDSAVGATLYVDGIQRAFSSAKIGKRLMGNTQAVGLVRGDGTGANIKLDEFRIWNTARTATEIADNYQRSLDRHPNLVLNMNFDSTLTHDSSGFSNHGTVVGNVTQEDSDNDKLHFNAPLSGS